MNKCKECGKEIPKNQEYCMACEFELEELDKEEKTFERFKKKKIIWS